MFGNPKPSTALIKRRRDIWEGVQPAIEQAHQQQEAYQMGMELALDQTLEADLFHKPDLADVHDQKDLSLKLDTFLWYVNSGKIALPKKLIDLYPNYLKPAKLISSSSTSPPELSEDDLDKDVFWLRKPVQQGLYNYNSLVESCLYELYCKKAGQNKFAYVPTSGAAGFSKIVVGFENKEIIEGDLSPIHAFEFRKMEAAMSSETKSGHGSSTFQKIKKERSSLEDKLVEIWDKWLGNVSETKYRKEETHFKSLLRPGQVLRDPDRYINFPTLSRNNPNVNKIKLSAVKKLFEYYDQSEFGIDYVHPAAGFSVVDKALRYSDAPRPLEQTRVEVKYIDPDEKKDRKKEEKIFFSGLNQQAWWDYLKTEHFKYIPHDDINELKRSYEEFLNYLKQYKLFLPPVPSEDKRLPNNIKSLPLALGVITALLKNCSDEDKPYQLNCALELDLGPAGAIRAINEPEHRTRNYHYTRCRFVLPPMRCEEKHFGEVHGFLTYGNQHYKLSFESDYSATRIIKVYSQTAIDRYTQQPSPEAVVITQEIFWRYLAHHEGMPLSFYLGNEEKKLTGAVERIERFTHPEIKANLYCILAALTTEQGLMRGRDNEKMLQHWGKLCDVVYWAIKFSLGGIAPAIRLLGLLRDLPAIPPLDLLDQVLTLCTQWIFSRKFDLINNSFDRLNLLLIFLKTLKNTDQDEPVDPALLYRGMRFVGKDAKSIEAFTNAKNSLFIDFLTKFETIQQLDSKDKDGILFLFQSFDTFSLSIVDLKNANPTNAILAALDFPKDMKGDHDPEEIISFKKNCLNLLNQISDKKGLTKDDLFAFLGAMKKIAELKIPTTAPEKTLIFIQFLQEKHSTRFDENFLYHQKLYNQHDAMNCKILDLIEEKISKDQQFMVKSLLSFHRGVDLLKQCEIIDSIGALSSICSEHGVNFTDCLERLLAYTQLHQKDPQYDLIELNLLLKLIIEDNNLVPLESLLYHPDMEKMPRLIKKGLVLYQTICPWLELNHHRVSQQRSFVPACEVFLNVPAHELGLDIDLSFPEDRSTDLIRKLSSSIAKDEVAPLRETVAELLENSIYCQNKTVLRASVFLRSLSSPEKETGPSVQGPLPDKKVSLDALPQKAPKVLSWQEKIAFYAKKVVQKPLAIVTKMVSKAPDESRITTIAVIREKKSTDQDLTLEKIKSELSQLAKDHEEYSKRYEYFILNYYNHIYLLLETKPIIKNDLLKYIGQFAKKYQPHTIHDEKEEEKKDAKKYTDALYQQFKKLEVLITNKDLKPDEVRKILYYGHQMERPQDLITIIETIHNQITPENQAKFYHLLAKLMGEHVLQGPEGPQQKKVQVLTADSFIELCQLAGNRHDVQEIVFGRYYQYPPYQILEEIVKHYRHKEEKEYPRINKSLIDASQKHDAKPFERDPENKFDRDKACAQAKLFTKNDIFTEKVLDALNNRIEHYRGFTTSRKIKSIRSGQFKAKFLAINELKGEEKLIAIADLTALLTELLYSTTNQEFNYTQILTLFSLLASEGNTIHQVSTGAGKSRIGMALLAGKSLMGLSPDFVTETMELAERDFYKTKAFFDACDIDTLLIDANTAIEDYCAPRRNAFIGFSGREQLGLFHNKLKSTKHEYHIDLSKKVLVLDEADTFYRDIGALHLNLAKTSVPLEDVRWAYPFVLDFTRDPNFYSYYVNDNEEYVYQKLQDYIEKQITSKSKKEQFRRINNFTKEIFLRAAVIVSARSFKRGIRFDADVAQDVTMFTDTGMRVASKALAKIDNLVSNFSIYSDAVQQFLHVRLNQERNEERKSPTGQIKISKTPYYIEPISQIMYSSTSYTLLKQYSQLVGMTGSSGSGFERREMRQRFLMNFIDVPDHHLSQRVDLMPHLVLKNEDIQPQVLQYDKEIIAENRPHVIINANDIESAALAAELKKDGHPVQEIDGTLAGYQDKLKKAGKGGHTTSTTDIFSRGVDVKLDKDANHLKGLAITACGIQNTCQTIQTFGRAGRYKMPGTARTIFSLEALKTEFGRTGALDGDALIGLFTNRDDYVKRLRLEKDKRDQDVRCVNIFINGFFDKIFDDFSNKLQTNKIKCDDEDQLDIDWMQFVKGLNDEIKAPANDEIKRLLKEKKLDSDEMIKHIKSMFAAAIKYYNEKFLNIYHLAPFDVIVKDQDYTQLTQQLLPVDTRTIPVWQKTYGEYDPSHAGQNVVYHTWFAETRWALKEWRKGKGIAEVFWSTQHKKAAAKGLGLAHPERSAFWRDQRVLWANVRATYLGNLNNEWQAYEQAYMQLDTYIKVLENEAPNNPHIVAANQLLIAVRHKAANINGKRDLQLVTETLRQTHTLMTSPSDQAKERYQDLQNKLTDDRSWQKIKNVMKVIGGLVFLGLSITMLVMSHGFAAPIAFYGIKFSIHLILSLSSSMLTLSPIVVNGLFNEYGKSGQCDRNLMNEVEHCHSVSLNAK